MSLSQIDVTRDVMNVNLVIHSKVDPAKIKYFIEIVKWTSDDFEIFLNFTNPLLLSQGSQPDEVYLSVKNPYLFLSKATGEPINTKNLDIHSYIPRMMPKGVDPQKLQ